MSNIINMPESVEIAIYSLILLSRGEKNKRINVNHLAEEIGASSNHLHKVLQLLAKKGYIKARKGPGGGYTLAMSPSEISLLDIYETMEGPMTESGCPLGRVRCPFNQCIYEGLFTKIKKDVKNYFKDKKISNFTGGKYGSKI